MSRTREPEERHLSKRKQGTEDHPRHILSLSGGKDSTALALYLKDRLQGLEYVFCDTGKELEETYEYLRRLAVHLGTTIQYLKPEVGFDDLLAKRRNYLPSPQVRWCTEYLKIRPLEKFIGDDFAVMYIGIRADESQRKGYISSKPNIEARFPFVEDGITLTQVNQILERSKLGLPDYYRWRSRSGCFFCFFQQRREWVGLLEQHPKLFKEAMGYEREDPTTGVLYTWSQGESLAELSGPERVKQIKADYERRRGLREKYESDKPLRRVFCEEEHGRSDACLICHL